MNFFKFVFIVKVLFCLVQAPSTCQLLTRGNHGKKAETVRNWNHVTHCTHIKTEELKHQIIIQLT